MSVIVAVESQSDIRGNTLKQMAAYITVHTRQNVHTHTLATVSESLLNMCENQIVPSIDCKLINLQVKRGIPALQHLLHIPPIVSTQTKANHSCPREDELAQAELPPVNMLWPSRPILP